MIEIPFLVLIVVVVLLLYDDAHTDTEARIEERRRIDHVLSRSPSSITIPFLDSREERLYDWSHAPFDPNTRLYFLPSVAHWTRENLAGPVYVLKDLDRQCTHLAFTYEEDAFLFKMTWL